MNSLLVKGVIGILKFFLRLLILAFTGEWVDLDKLGKPAQPTPSPGPGVDGPGTERALLAQRLDELRARQSSASQATREHYERFARDFAAPLEQHLRELGVGLRRRTFVALMRVDQADASLLREVREHTRYWPMVMPASGAPSEGRLRAQRGDSLTPYVTAARERARALAEDAPGLLQQVRLAHGWPTALFLAGAERAEVLRAAFAVWLGPLLADILVTLQLGPGYTRYLLRSLGAASEVGSRAEPLASPAPLLAHSLRPGAAPLLSEEPPLLLRLYASLGTLEYLGYFEEAERIERIVVKNVGDAPELSSPMGATGNPLKWSYELWRGELQGVLESILEDAQPALGGDTLLDAPGAAFLHGEHARALRLMAALSEDAPAGTGLGDHVDASARDWLAAALLLSAASQGVGEEEIARRLRSVLGGPTARRLGEPAASPSALTRGPVEPRRLGAMLRDPKVIRDAVVLGTLLGPRAKAPRARRRSR